MSTTPSSGSTSSKSESAKSAAPAESKSASSSSSSGNGGGKSARESVGGSKDVHYGYFSSVRTPEYRSGWDAIWGKKSQKKSASKAKAKGPIDLDLDFDKLPPDLRDGLLEHARKKLRRTPAGFKKLHESGAIEWTLSVRLDG